MNKAGIYELKQSISTIYCMYMLGWEKAKNLLTKYSSISYVMHYSSLF